MRLEISTRPRLHNAEHFPATVTASPARPELLFVTLVPEAQQQDRDIPARVPQAEHATHEGAGDPHPLCHWWWMPKIVGLYATWEYSMDRAAEPISVRNCVALMRTELAQHGRSEQIVLHPTRAELPLLAGSMKEAIEAIEDWEFPARLGADKANARALRTELGDLIARLPPE